MCPQIEYERTGPNNVITYVRRRHRYAITYRDDQTSEAVYRVLMWLMDTRIRFTRRDCLTVLREIRKHRSNFTRLSAGR